MKSVLGKALSLSSANLTLFFVNIDVVKSWYLHNFELDDHCVIIGHFAICN